MTTRVVGVRAASLVESSRRGHRSSRIYDDVQWMGLLRSVNALQMYQRATRGPVEGSKVVDFLLLDPIFPRSVTACVAAIRAALAALPRPDLTRPAVDELEALVAAVPPGSAIADNHDGAALDAAMDRVLLGLASLNAAVDAALFHAVS